MQAQNTRQLLVRNSGAIFLIRFFPTLANLLIILYFSRRLSLEAYGAYQHIWAQYYVLAAVAVAGLPAFAITVGPQALFTLIRQWHSRQRWLLVLWPLIWAIAFAFIQTNSGILSFWLSVGFLLSGVAGIVLEGLLTAARKFLAVIWINVSYTLIFLGIHYLFTKQAFALEGLFASLLLLGLGRIVFLLPALLPVWRTAPENKEALSAGMGKLWLHLGLFELSQVVFRWADKFVVSLFLSAGAMALYFNGALEIPFLPILLGAAGSALLLQMHNAGDQETTQRKAELVRLSAVVLSSLVLPLFFFLLFFAEPLFRLALSEKYLAALPVFWMMLLVLPLRAYNFTTLLQHLHKGALINMGALLDIVLALSLCYPLYQWMGLPGIALSFVASTYVQVIFYIIYILKYTGLRLDQILPLTNWLWKMTLLCLLFAGTRIFSAERTIGTAWELLPGAGLWVLASAALLTLDFIWIRRSNKP